METVLKIGDAFILENGKEYQVYNILEIDNQPYLVIRPVPIGDKGDFFDVEKFPPFLVKEKIEGEELSVEKVVDEEVLKQAKQQANIL